MPKPTSGITKAKALTPQAAAVLKHLRSAGSITGVEAAAVLKVRHLPRRILDLKERGVSIRKEMKQDSQGQRYARYWLQENNGNSSIAA